MSAVVHCSTGLLTAGGSLRDPLPQLANCVHVSLVSRVAGLVVQGHLVQLVLQRLIGREEGWILGFARHLAALDSTLHHRDPTLALAAGGLLGLDGKSTVCQTP
jgi:hypothetical protein